MFDEKNFLNEACLYFVFGFVPKNLFTPFKYFMSFFFLYMKMELYFIFLFYFIYLFFFRNSRSYLLID